MPKQTKTKTALAVVPKAKRNPPPAAVKAMETAAVTIDDGVRGRFDCFMSDATTAEKMFLNEVFMERDGAYSTLTPEHIGIAGAFGCALSDNSSLTVVEREYLLKLQGFWSRFHAETPSLESEFLAFLTTATEELKAILRRVIAVNQHHLKLHVTPVLHAIEHYNGCTTPSEEFILEILADYGDGTGFTPESARVDLVEFEESYNDAIELARYLLSHHREYNEGSAAAPAKP